MSDLPKNPAVHGGAFLVMAFVGWKLAGDPAAEAAPGAAQATAKTSARPARAALRFGTPAHIRERLAGIRAAGSKEDRLRATIDLVNSLSIAELAAWKDGRWFDTGDRYELTLFDQIANQRWTMEDAEGFVAWNLKNGGVSADKILSSWAKSDPARLTAYFKEHPNDSMELRMLTGLAKGHPALALGRLQELIGRGIPRNSSGYEGQLLHQLAQASPGALESILDSLPTSWRSQAEAALIGQKLAASFPEEIRKLWERPDGLKIFQSLESSGETGEKLLGELANLPASWRASISSNYYSYINESNAAKWLEADLEGSGFTAEQASQLRSGALQRMSFRKPEDALRLMGDLELDDSARTSLIANIFANAARTPGKQEELMALLGSEEDRRIAGDVMARAPDSQAPAKIEKPEEWLAKAGTLDPQLGNSYQFFGVLQEWDKEKISELTGQFRAMPDDGKLQVARVIATNPYGNDALEPSFTGEAISYLIAHPQEPEDGQPRGNSDAVRLASQHAVKWAAKDPAAASEWVQTLPAGDAKLWAQKNLAANWAQYDPDAAGQWAASLPADARKEVEAFMKK